MAMDGRILRRIFSDANVADIDMSRWAEAMSMWVWADHYRPWEVICPLVVVTFEKVSSWCVSVPELADVPPVRRHWRISDATVRRRGQGWSLCLEGGTNFPTVKIVCGDVRVREVRKQDSLERLFGRRRVQFSGRLVRPDLSWFLARQAKGRGRPTS